jgi:hypothetical protein
MKEPVHNPVIIYLVAIGLLISVAVICEPVSAGLKVSGSKYLGDAAPGDVIVHQMTVSTKPDDPPMDILVDVMGFGQSLQQSYSSLSPADDISPYSARSFISLSSPSFHVNPGESKSVNATITIPRNVGAGGRYALIYIHNAPVGGGSTGFITAIEVPVMVTIAKSAIAHTGTITGVNVGEIVPGQPIKISTSLKNTGNHHYYNTKNDVKVTDAGGKEVAAKATEPSVYAILPTYTVNYDVTLDKSLLPGTYTVSSKVSLEDGTVLDTKTTTFEVPEHYVPTATVSSAQTAGVVKIQSQQTGVSPARTTYSGTDVIMVVAALGLCVVVIGKKGLQ